MRKETMGYYFSVEGETEKWYLDWLQKTINQEQASKYLVKINSGIQKDPLSYVKRAPIVKKTKITHLCDYESDEPVHTEAFKTTIDRMKAAKASGKNVIYQLGYSNFTFELWIILHMSDCKQTFIHRKQYLQPLNRVFFENFERLKDYKHEDNFKRILQKLTLDNVKQAIRRAKDIMQKNQEYGYTIYEYKGYQYYKENPSLTVWESIEAILKECELI